MNINTSNMNINAVAHELINFINNLSNYVLFYDLY